MRFLAAAKPILLESERRRLLALSRHRSTLPGMFKAVLFPEAYQRYGGLVFETRMLRVAGRVEAPGQIHCDRLEAVKTSRAPIL